MRGKTKNRECSGTKCTACSLHAEDCDKNATTKKGREIELNSHMRISASVQTEEERERSVTL